MNVTNLSDALPANLTGAIRAANVSLYGSGAELVNKGALTLTGPAGFGNRFVNDTTGTVTQQAAVGFGGIVTSRGTWIVDGDHALTQNGNGRFQQDGTLRKTSGTGTTTLDGQFDGTAPTFDVRAGTILLRDHSTWTGGARIDTAANTVFRFQRDSECCWAMSISGTFTGTGSGRVEFVNGNLGGAATINFPAGVFHVTGGNVYGHTNAGTLTISNASVHGGFSNTGTLRQVGDAGYDGAVSNTGLWDIQGDHTLARNANGALRNDGGTFRKSSGTGLSYLDRIDGTHPTFDVDTGTLVLREPSTWDSGAQIDAATGSIFRFQRASECCWAIEASGTLTGTGGGRVEMVNGNLYPPGAPPLTLDFPAGYLHISGGRINNLTNAGELTIGNTGIHNLANTGTARQTGNVSFTGTSTNTGLWDMQGNPTLANGGNGRFVNNGTTPQDRRGHRDARRPHRRQPPDVRRPHRRAAAARPEHVDRRRPDRCRGRRHLPLPAQRRVLLVDDRFRHAHRLRRRARRARQRQPVRRRAAADAELPGRLLPLHRPHLRPHEHRRDHARRRQRPRRARQQRHDPPDRRHDVRRRRHQLRPVGHHRATSRSPRPPTARSRTPARSARARAPAPRSSTAPSTARTRRSTSTRARCSSGPTARGPTARRSTPRPARRSASSRRTTAASPSAPPGR